jgi:hypothetical protein
VRDLNNSSYSNVRFYSDADVNAQHILADRIVELNFNDLFVGQVYNDNNTINRSKQIQTGETKSNPPQPIYETVTATVYVTRRTMESHAALECRIYDQATGSNILFDRFPDNYTWRQETARYTGDNRALEPADLTLINRQPDNSLPSRHDNVFVESRRNYFTQRTLRSSERKVKRESTRCAAVSLREIKIDY